MKKIINLFLITILLLLTCSASTFAQILVPEGNVAFVIASADDKTPTLTNREKVVSDKLKALGYSDITYVGSDKVAKSDLSKARFIIATEKQTMDAATVNSLIESGKGIALLYNAGNVVGGSWESRAIGGRYGVSAVGYIQVENGKAFLEGYGSDVSFQIQSASSAYYISEKYPSDWTVIGTNTRNPNFKTTFYKEHASGGKGVIFTYEPQYYTWSGESTFARIIEWIAMPSLRKGVTVPEGDVAFVITNPSDVTLPVGLTDREKAVKDQLESLGYTITYVSFSRLEISDLSKARFIIGVEYPSLGIITINSLIESGKGVALLYNAGSVAGGSWGSGGGRLQVENGKAFLEGYGSGISFEVSSSAYYISEKYPPDWIVIGTNTGNPNYKTAFYKKHASGGKGVIFTYYPQNYTWRGKSTFARIIEWIAMLSLRKGVTVPEGNVAFVITNPDDVTLPVGLTDREKAVKNQLESLGYIITYVSFSRLEISDLSKARFVIGVEYPSLGANTINSLIASGKGIALLYNAGNVVGGSWESRAIGGRYGVSAVGYIQVENGKAFLEGYGSDVSFQIQSASSAYYISEKYPSDWTVIGRNTKDVSCKTALYREHDSGGRGALFTYDPQYYTTEGNEILAKIAEWASGGLPIGKPTSKPSFTLSLATGLNFISLPMKPDIPYTARTFAERLGATLVIRYDAPSQEFVPFVPEASETDGFVIEGGQGYIVNVLEEKQVTFRGTVWTNTPPASPKQAPEKENAIWAFAVAGFVSTESDLKEPFSELRVIVKNQRTGQLSQCTLTGDMGEFATAFVHLSRKSVVRAGDMLEITVTNSRGQFLSAPVVREVSKIDLAKATVVANLRLGEIIPSQSQLFQNYPNPFNPETWIPFQLASSYEVTIRIYNVAGQLVRMLNLGQKTAGGYLDKNRAAYWDGRNELSEKVSSGVYFYSIEAGNFRSTRKLVVAK